MHWKTLLISKEKEDWWEMAQGHRKVHGEHPKFCVEFPIETFATIYLIQERVCKTVISDSQGLVNNSEIWVLPKVGALVNIQKGYKLQIKPYYKRKLRNINL